MLRKNPPEVHVTTEQKPCTDIICIVMQTSLQLFKMPSEEKSFLSTSDVDTKFWSSYETLDNRWSETDNKILSVFAHWTLDWFLS